MANTPKKAKDPTEVALSAIQQALNISDGKTELPRDLGSRELASRRDSGPTSPSSSRPDSQPLTKEEPVKDRAPRRAANDDRETIGQLLHSIQKGRPDRNVYTLAAVFS